MYVHSKACLTGVNRHLFVDVTIFDKAIFASFQNMWPDWTHSKKSHMNPTLSDDMTSSYVFTQKGIFDWYLDIWQILPQKWWPLQIS